MNGVSIGGRSGCVLSRQRGSSTWAIVNDDRPALTATLAAFGIDRLSVTNTQCAKFLD
jgi:hypothetical protein